MSKQVYKIANGCMITLAIPPDAKTNESRPVKHKKTAKYRCNKALVLSILDLKNGKYHVSIPSSYSNNFIYEVGKIVEENDFMENDDICTHGIHYYLTSLAAYIHHKDGSMRIMDNGTIDGGKKCHSKNKKKFQIQFEKKMKKICMLQYNLKCDVHDCE